MRDLFLLLLYILLLLLLSLLLIFRLIRLSGPFSLEINYEILQTVGRTLWKSDQLVSRFLHIQRKTQTQTDIHALSGIRTHDPNDFAEEVIS
jgi:hypothetical protein